MSVAATMPHATMGEAPSAFEGYSKTSTQIRQTARPLDIPDSNDTRNDHSSATLGRRDSKLGLRSIFGRPKPTRSSNDVSVEPKPATTTSTQDRMTHGIPYSSLPPGKPTARTQVLRPLSTTIEESENLPQPPDVPAETTRRKSGGNAKSHGRQNGHSGDLPLMHKAYPQAVLYSTLTTTAVPADLILKAQEKKATEKSSGVDTVGKIDDKGRSKKKHRRSKSGSEFEWTSKTYILVTSGYLLEYSTEGPFDRAPEKVLRLGKSSAVFASDLLPGRHWVLQVSSAMGSDGVASTDSSKSFLSRLPFRGNAEKKSTANMLLVFDNADVMDEWLVTLRRAIQALGGKQAVSETGKLIAEHAVPLRGQASQRTLTFKDYERRPKHIAEAAPWEHEFDRRGSDASFTPSDSARNQSLDDTSTTNSVVSQEGQQLDSLRDSSHRLSYISSGQRTFITSEDSSPGGSPTADSFTISIEEPSRRHPEHSMADGRLRPNASAKNDKRKSLQAVSPFSEFRPGSSAPRPHSTMIKPSEVDTQPQVSPPNFSVPQSSNRRHSSMRPPPAPEASCLNSSMTDFHAPAPSRSMSAKRPPTTLRTSRPLSMVTDYPSSRVVIPERPTTKHGDTTKLSETLEPIPASRPTSQQSDLERTPSIAEPRSPPKPAGLRISPRRLSSMGALRQKQGSEAPVATLAQSLPPDAPRMRSLHPSSVRAQDPERCYSTVDVNSRSSHFLVSQNPRISKRSSMLPFVPDQRQYHPPPAPPPSGPLPAVPTASNIRGNHLKPAETTNSHALLNRRSMPQLADGPPPAPPPTCALPPIPQRASQMF